MMPANVEIQGLNRVLRALRQFGPDATAELRDESQSIAANLMVPTFQRRAASVPNWGAVLADSIRVRRDRVPAVNIGYKKRVTSGGASTVQLRYATDTGTRRPGGNPVRGPAPFTRTNWLTAAAAEYKDPAMAAWGDALERVIDKWNRGH